MSPQARAKYQALRSRMMDAGFTVRSWAENRGFVASTCYDALKGKRDGIEARRIRRAAEKAFNV